MREARSFKANGLSLRGPACCLTSWPNAESCNGLFTDKPLKGPREHRQVDVKSRATEDSRTELQVTRIDVRKVSRARASIGDRGGAQVSADPAKSLVFGSWAYRYLALTFR